MRTFTLFDEGNDPHGEHDFASIEVDGENYFFKIDYYDTDIRYLSDDPSDPHCTKRIMTIMILMRTIVIDGKRYSWRDLLKLGANRK